MKNLMKILIVTAIMLSAACSYDEISKKIIPKEESEFAQEYLLKLQKKDFDYIYQHIDKSLENQINNEKLMEIAEYFPSGELLSTELIGSRVNKFNSQWQGNFSFEYQFSSGWALANVVLQKSAEKISVIGFNVYRQMRPKRKSTNSPLVANPPYSI